RPDRRRDSLRHRVSADPRRQHDGQSADEARVQQQGGRLVNFLVVLPLIGVFLLLAWQRVGLLVWALAWWGGLFLALRWGFAVPIPFSVFSIYMSIISIAILAYLTSSDERRAQVSRPIVSLIVEPRFRMLLAALVVAIPGAAAANVWLQA